MRARQAQEAIEKSPWQHEPEPPIQYPPRRHCCDPRQPTTGCLEQ